MPTQMFHGTCRLPVRLTKDDTETYVSVINDMSVSQEQSFIIK